MKGPVGLCSGSERDGADKTGDSGGARAAGGGRPGPTGRIGPPQARGASSRPPGAPFLIEKQWRNERERPLDAVALTCYLPVVGPDETIIDSDDFGVCFSATKP